MYHALVKRQVKQIIIFKTSTPSATQPPAPLVSACLANDSACHLSVCISLSLLRYCRQFFFLYGTHSLLKDLLSRVCSLEYRQGFACLVSCLYKCWHNKSSKSSHISGYTRIYKSFNSQSSGIAHRLSLTILCIPHIVLQIVRFYNIVYYTTRHTLACL